MGKDVKSDYDKKISERLIQILDYAGLEIKGIAALTGKSVDIFYAVISCRRSLSNDLAKHIGKSLDFDGNIVFNINSPIPPPLKVLTIFYNSVKITLITKNFLLTRGLKTKILTL